MENEAELKRRFLALFIDFLAIIAWGIILFAISMFVFFVIMDGVPKFDELRMNLISLTMIAPAFLYSIIMEMSKKRATIGKQKMKMEVVAVHSKKSRLWQAVVRNVIKFLPWQFAHMMIFRGFVFNWELTPFWASMFLVANVLPLIWIAVVIFRKDHRGIHDLISRTVVVDSFRTNGTYDR